MGGLMARILGIHGIAQQYRGPETLKTDWLPALRDHDVSPYLTAMETGRAVANGLGRRERG
jgi:hypothetical protein